MKTSYKKYFYKACVVFSLMCVCHCTSGKQRGSMIDPSMEGYAGQDENVGGTGGNGFECEAGRLNCPCLDNDLCEGELVCDLAANFCKYDLACVEFGCVPNQFCRADDEDQIVCVDAQCEPGFEWNDEIGQCEAIDGSSCEDRAGLSILEACNDLLRSCEEEGSARCGDCYNGTRRQGSECVDIIKCNDLPCAVQNRTCVESNNDQDAICGDCAEGFVLNDQNNCLSQEDACNVLNCANENRQCSLNERVSCGECLPGFVANDENGCIPEFASCEDAGCVQDQVCEEVPAPRCLEQCNNEKVWDREEQNCRDIITCEDLECPEDRDCFEVQGRDAVCGCQDGFGFDILDPSRGCVACMDGNPNCPDGEQATGRAYISDGRNECKCEPSPGYFNVSNEIRRCDSDGDGWFDSDAASAFEGGQEAVQVMSKTKCLLRKVTHVVLRSENRLSQNNPLHEKVVSLDSSLSLYELPINDGKDTGREVDLQFQPRQLNGFTKACIRENGDFNQNGIHDYLESQDGGISGDLSEDLSDVFFGYLGRYPEFSYFLELHDGWFEPTRVVDGFLTGRYIIQERRRMPGEQVSQVPVQYPVDGRDGIGEVNEDSSWFQTDPGLPGEEEPSTTRHQYWQECERKTDRLYMDDFPGYEGLEGSLESRAGGDFTEEKFLMDGQGSEALMKHHSQFKCVLLKSQDDYQDPQYSLLDTPYVVYRKGNEGQDADIDGHKELFRGDEPSVMQEAAELEGNRWFLNNCRVTNNELSVSDAYSHFNLTPQVNQDSEEQIEINNPTFPMIECFASPNNINFMPLDNALADPEEIDNDHVYWAAVGYENYSLLDIDYVEPGEEHGISYRRGCINECAEYTVNACFDGEIAGEIEPPRFTCDHEYKYHFGKLTCGCGKNYGTLGYEEAEPCSLGCPDEELMTDETFDIGSRKGVWMCSRVEITASTELREDENDNGYTIQGSILPSGVDSDVIQGGGYTLRTR